MSEQRYRKESSNLPQVYYVDSNRSIYAEEESVNMKDFIIGALVGGIVGAAAGLLLAPKAGRELRGDVAYQAVNLKDKSAELSATAKEKTAQLSQQLKEQSTQLVDKVKSKTSKTPTVFDDGTVSAEGEEPLDEVISALEETIAEATANIAAVVATAQEDRNDNKMAEASKPSSL